MSHTRKSILLHYFHTSLFSPDAFLGPNPPKPLQGVHLQGPPTPYHMQILALPPPPCNLESRSHTLCLHIVKLPLTKPS